MIDIVFLLIIFFMVAAQFAQQARVDLNLPLENGEQDESLQESSFIINILDNGDVIIDSTEGAISMVVLENRIREEVEQGNLTWENILIRADENGAAGTMNKVFHLLNKYNFSAAKIATESN
ncbi:MAG: biopolymer transporter ExbD [Phycisphaerae bacterium]|nr:biopolymer transporter ExbD [Phycisphaerae bacterium]